MKIVTEVKKLDAEWVTLLKQAKAMGMSPEEVREFLNQKKQFYKF